MESTIITQIVLNCVLLTWRLQMIYSFSWRALRYLLRVCSQFYLSWRSYKDLQ